jgi:putative MATE family efflux protein
MNVPGTLTAIWLGRVSAEALAAAGIGMALRITLISPLMALSASSGAVVARYVGAKDQDRANCAVLQAVLLFFLSSLGIGLLTLGFLGPLLRLAGATGELLPLAKDYTRILMLGLVAMEMVPSIGFMLVAAGNPQLSLQVNFLVSVIRVLGEPFLVLGLGGFAGLGITGAALALVTANVAGMIYALYLLLTRQASAWIDIHNLGLNWPIMKRILLLALPATLQKGTPNLAQNILLRLMSAYGTVPLATYNVLRGIFNLALLPGMGVARSAAALVGQNLGADKPGRAERSMHYVGFVILALALVLVTSVIVLRPWIMPIFSQDHRVLAQSQYMTQVLGLGMGLYVLAMGFENGLNGAGDTLSPMLIGITALWVIQIPVIYLFAQVLGWGAQGIWWAITLSHGCRALLLFLRFLQGRWKHIEL